MDLQVPLWLQQVVDFEKKCRTPRKLLRNEGRRAIWVMCSMLGASSKGIPGQSCRLFERYLTARFCTAGPALQSAEGKTRLRKELTSKMFVTMAACVQLASKIACLGTALNSKSTQIYLSHFNIHTTISDISQMECLVYKTLDFLIPLYTSVDIAQLLAEDLGFPISAMKDIGLLTDLAEYHRDKVDAMVQQMYEGPSSSFNSSPVSTVHLAAGTTATIARHLPDFKDIAVSRLADLTKAPASYIHCIVKAILTFAVSQPTSHEEEPQKKQRLV